MSTLGRAYPLNCTYAFFQNRTWVSEWAWYVFDSLKYTSQLNETTRCNHKKDSFAIFSRFVHAVFTICSHMFPRFSRRKVFPIQNQLYTYYISCGPTCTDWDNLTMTRGNCCDLRNVLEVDSKLQRCMARGFGFWSPSTDHHWPNESKYSPMKPTHERMKNKGLLNLRVVDVHWLKSFFQTNIDIYFLWTIG